MNILVAGGCGFVGANLIRALAGRGDRLVVLDNLSSGLKRNIGEYIGGAVDLWVEDVAASILTVPRFPEPFDVIVHLASPASPHDYSANQMSTLAANSIGTANLLGLARHDKARFIYASTSEVYGDPIVHPQPETYWGNVDPIGPRSMYDEGKRFGEALVTAAATEAGVPGAILRIFNTYGPFMRSDDGRVVSSFVWAALHGDPLYIYGSGTQTRSLMFVQDLVTALMHVIDDLDPVGLVANVGNPAELTMVDLAQAVLLATHSKSEVRFVEGRPGDPKRRQPVIERMTDRYGWAPRIDLAEGLERTVRWFRDGNWR